MKPARRPASSRRYDMDAAFMLFQRLSSCSNGMKAASTPYGPQHWRLIPVLMVAK
jgi:hypothetical protein